MLYWSSSLFVLFSNLCCVYWCLCVCVFDVGAYGSRCWFSVLGCLYIAL